MPNPEKVARVAELKARIDGSDAMLLTEYRGLTVSEITQLRRSLAEGGASFAVVKNTLMRRAAADAGVEELDPLLEGPSAISFVSGDPVAAAKSVVAAQKLYPTLVLKGAYMDGRVLSADEARSLADLDSREVMLSKIAGLLKSDLSKAAALFVSAQSKFVSLLDAYKAKFPAEEAPVVEAEVEAPEAPPAEVEAPAQAEAEVEAEAAPEAAEPEEAPEVAEAEATPAPADEPTTDEAEASDDEKE